MSTETKQNGEGAAGRELDALVKRLRSRAAYIRTKAGSPRVFDAELMEVAARALEEVDR